MLNFYFRMALLIIGLWLSLAGYRHIQENGINIMGLGLLLSIVYSYFINLFFEVAGDIK